MLLQKLPPLQRAPFTSSLSPPPAPTRSIPTPNQPSLPCLLQPTKRHTARLSPCRADWSKFSDRVRREDRKVTAQSAVNGSSAIGSSADGAPDKYEDGGSGWGRTWDDDWDPKVIPVEITEERAGIPPRRREGDPVRDMWLSPLLDVQSVLDALNFNEEKAEERIKKEALTNDVESQDAIKFAGTMISTALASGLVVSKVMAEPILNFTLTHNPHAFELNDHQKVEAAHHIHIEEFRVKMQSTLGSIPPMDERELFRHLHEFAKDLEEEEREHNEHSLLNVVSDSVTSAVLFGFIAQASDGRRALFSTAGRLFGGLSDLAKAFIIILVADTLVGYHSAEGWTGFINLVCEHWGFEPSNAGLSFFVATVPVTADVVLKYWLFTGLNKISPEAVVTIKAMDRH